MTTHDCETARTRFSDLLEGTLSPAEARALENEVETCASCAKELAELRATLGRLHGLRETAPSSFVNDVKKQIHRRSRGRFFARRWLLFGRIPFEWVSFVMILAMLVYYIVQMQNAPTDVTPTP